MTLEEWDQAIAWNKRRIARMTTATAKKKGGAKKEKPKKNDVEVLGGSAPFDPKAEAIKQEEAAGAIDRKSAAAGDNDGPAKKIKARGPTTGTKAPLFHIDEEIECEVFRSKGMVVVGFTEELGEWKLPKRATRLACRLIATHAAELPVVVRREGGKEDVDLGATIGRDQGCVVIKFAKKLKQWELGKRAALYAIDLIRAESKLLSQSKED